MKFKAALAAIVGLVVVNSAFASNDVMVSDAWVREGPPNAPALGGFMVIRNHSSKPRTLVKVSSSGFGAVEMHRTMEHDGMMKMKQQQSVVIPAEGALAFRPGDYHMMMMKPKKAYKTGDHVVVTLGFADGFEIKVKYAVRKDEGKGMDHGQHNMDHDKHEVNREQHEMNHNERHQAGKKSGF